MIRSFAPAASRSSSSRRALILLPLAAFTFAPSSAWAQLTSLDVSPQVLAGRGSTVLTLRLPPGAIPPSGVRIGVFEAGSGAKLADFARPFTAGNNGLQATLSLDAEPGRYDIRLLRGDKSRAPLTQSATVAVAGIDREPGWWLFNGSPVIGTRESPTVGTSGLPFFLPGLKRSLARTDKARTANTRTEAPIAWRTLAFPPLSEWLRDATAARESALHLASQSREAKESGFVGCAMFANSSANANFGGGSVEAQDARTLAAASPEAIVRAVQAARASCQSLGPDAALILTLADVPPALAARVVDLAAPECDAVWMADLDSSDAVSLWPLKAARRVAEEQPQFDLPIFITPRENVGIGAAEVSGAIEAWMSGATGIVLPHNSSSEAASLERTLESNLSLFVGSVTLEDSGLLRAGDALSLFRRLRDIGRVPLLARTFEVSSRRDHSNREGRRTAEPFALRWTQGTPPSDLLAAIRDATKDGSRVYFEGSPFPGGATASTSGFDAQGWRDVLQANVRASNGAAAGTPSTSALAGSANDYASEADTSRETRPNARLSPGARLSQLKMDDVWTFGLARGQSVPVEQSLVVTPARAPSPAELGDAAPPKNQSERERERLRPAPRVVASLSDGSVGTLISPSAASLRHDESGAPLPRGEVVWTPHLLRSASNAAASTVEASGPRDSGPSASSLAAYDASISTLLQPALVRLFDRSAGAAATPTSISDDATAIASLPSAVGVRVCVRASKRGTLLLALVNPSDHARALSLQTRAAGGYVFDLALNRVLPARTRALRVELDIDVPANGFRLIALAKDAQTFEQDRNTPRLKARVR